MQCHYMSFARSLHANPSTKHHPTMPLLLREMRSPLGCYHWDVGIDRVQADKDVCRRSEGGAGNRIGHYGEGVVSSVLVGSALYP